MAKLCKKPPVRFWIGVMIFFCAFMVYVSRVDIAITIIGMVKKTNHTKIAECTLNEMSAQEIADFYKKNDTEDDQTVVYDWSQVVQGHLISGFSYGYLVTPLLGGACAEYFGGFWVIVVCLISMTIFNFLSVPLLLWTESWGILFACRLFIGLFAGMIYPALQVIIGKWAPPEERGRFVGALMGNNLGTAIALPLLGAAVEHFGWRWGFYISSLQIMLHCIVFWFVAASSPEDHSWISTEEQNYILNQQGQKKQVKKRMVPYKAMLTSIPVYALVLTEFGNLWGLALQVTVIPKFIAEVLGFDLAKSGGLAALPFVFRFVTGFLFGALGDYLRATKKFKKTFLRKFFIIFSHILPGVCLFSLVAVGCNWKMAITLLVLSQTMNGAVVETCLQNPLDLAPNFAGSIYGCMLFLGGLAGILTPLLSGFITKDHNGMKEWHINFFLGGLMYFISGTIFVLFGSAKEQPWNRVEDEKNTENL